MNKNKAIFSGAIIVYFLICFEILIMISPFAGFFYAVFNPILLGLAKYPATKWLGAFFFTHLLVPPNDLLKFIRIMGSVLFTAGMIVFLVCALQVYAGKFFKRGPALKGLYSSIRHPQYVSLAVAGLGLAILWPRFLVVFLWVLMVLVYYLLARDEERRMQKQFPETYQKYMDASGMILPKSVEDFIGLSTPAGRMVGFVLLSAFAIGGAFLLRNYTINLLPLWSESNVVALPILLDDRPMLDHKMADILSLPQVSSQLKSNESYLVYFMPTDYVMQGLIGDTGGDWQLYKQHHTARMITDWVLHPFSHLSGAHNSMHDGSMHSEHGTGAETVRRLIFLKISNVAVTRPSDVFAIKAVRTPEFMIDVDVHRLQISDSRNLPVETAWGKVPTPAF
jgi:protein-S-isoprenylcysteine O-methyltransferase Ste14